MSDGRLELHEYLEGFPLDWMERRTRDKYDQNLIDLAKLVRELATAAPGVHEMRVMLQVEKAAKALAGLSAEPPCAELARAEPEVPDISWRGD